MCFETTKFGIRSNPGTTNPLSSDVITPKVYLASLSKIIVSQFKTLLNSPVAESK